MKIKARCVSAQLRLSPKKADEVTQFSFQQSEPVLGKPGDICFDSLIRVHVGTSGEQYHVGREYVLNLEVEKCSN